MNQQHEECPRLLLSSHGISLPPSSHYSVAVLLVLCFLWLRQESYRYTGAHTHTVEMEKIVRILKSNYGSEKENSTSGIG